MSDVIIEDVSEQYIQIGLINESHSNSYSINENLSLLIDSSSESNEDKSFLKNNDEWTKACIDFQIPEVFLSSSEKFVPQMLNLDIDEVGVNFSKGCYPGQEVVADFIIWVKQREDYLLLNLSMK
jgi:folate-binding protein YgfZ